MATKTIPQLTLRASLTDASMFEIDDGIQSYRITATQIVTYLQTKELITASLMIATGVVTEVKLAADAVSTTKLLNLAVTAAKLDDSFVHDLTGVTPVAADYLALADASDSNKKKKASVGLIRNAVYRSVTATDSVGIDDETMAMSGASFVSTLPTAASVAGKRYKYIHAGTSLTNVYTLNTTSAQTIGGIASGAYKLYTAGEVLVIESDGSNWIVVGRHTQSVGTAFTPGVGGTTGFGTITAAAGFWWRSGERMFGRMAFTLGTAGAAVGGIAVPGSLNYKSAAVPKSTATTAQEASIAGYWSSNSSASGNRNGNFVFCPGTNTTNLYATSVNNASGGSHNIAASNIATQAMATGEIISATFDIPILEWQP